MALPDDPLPKHVLDAIRGGNKIEAIKRLRQAAGLGLAEAKERIEAHERGDPGKPGTPGKPTTVAEFLAGELPQKLKEAIDRGNVIEAVKLLRDQQGLGLKLKEAKEAIERARPSFVASPDTPPDTFHKVVTALWWILALALAGVVAYYFLGGG